MKKIDTILLKKITTCNPGSLFNDNDIKKT